MPTNDPDFKRWKSERSNKRIKESNLRFPTIYISYDNALAADALAYFRESRTSISDLVCSLLIKEYEVRKSQDANNNMVYYMDEHQRRLLTLPRIGEYLHYERQGNKSVVKLFEEGAITQADLYDIWSCSNRIRNQIEKNTTARDAVNSLMMEEIKHGSKE